jgi:hypothetical protein
MPCALSCPQPAAYACSLFASQAVAGATALLLDTPPLTQEQLELLQLLDAGAQHVVLIVEGALPRLSCVC